MTKFRQNPWFWGSACSYNLKNLSVKELKASTKGWICLQTEHLMNLIHHSETTVRYSITLNYGFVMGKSFFWVQVRKVLHLEMVQAFGDIFKNIFPQHMWHFWKPSKYFILPAGCLNFESCLCQQMLKQFYLFKAFFYSHSYFKHLKIEMSAKSLNFWAQTAFFAVKRHFREKN